MVRAATRAGTDLLLTYFHYQAQAIGSCHITVAGFDPQAQFRTYIKAFKVCINSGINYIQAPKEKKEEGGIINISPELVTVKAE